MRKNRTALEFIEICIFRLYFLFKVLKFMLNDLLR